MKMKVHPGVVIAIIVILVGYVGTLLFKATAEKPPYPGQDAGHPSTEQQGPGGGGGGMKKPGSPEEAMKMGIPGASAPKKEAPKSE